MQKQGLSEERKKNLEDFCRNVGIHFKDIMLLETAFHHRSLSNEQKVISNERLEFLGDSVLGMVAAAYLYTHFDSPEGELSKIKSAVVSEKALAPAALTIGIDRLLEMGKGEERTGGRTKPAILADCMEAVIGAYYLDSGYKAAETYVLQFLVPEIDKVIKFGMKDYKTLLQETYQKTSKRCPVYELVSETGPEHEKTFAVVVHLGSIQFGPETAKSKKEAEQKAAKTALEYLNSKKN